MLVMYQGARQQDLNFAVADSGTCNAGPVNLYNASFACGQPGDTPVEGNADYAAFRLVYQPWESVQYYAGVAAGNYSMRVPSTTITNSLTGDQPGMMYTLGAKAVIIPDSIVMPAVAVDVSVSRARHYFNRRSPGGTPNANNNINERLDLMQYQVSVETSHLFNIVEKDRFDLVALKGGVRVEPYGGVRWSRTTADLKDMIDGAHAGGHKDIVTPFLGVRVPIFEHEGLFAESSFVGGFNHAMGLEIRFE